MIETIEFDDLELFVTIPEHDPNSLQIAFFATTYNALIDVLWSSNGDWEIRNIDLRSIEPILGIIQSIGPHSDGHLERRLWNGTTQALAADKWFLATLNDCMPDEIRSLLREDKLETAHGNWRQRP